MESNKKLISFDELRDIAKSYITKNPKITNYTDAFKKYDIDPNLNRDYLKLLIKNKEKNTKDKFRELMYTLNDADRINLGQNSNIRYEGRSSENIFNDILRKLNTDISYENFEYSLKKENYIEYSNFKIPFFEGNDEYFYSGMVNVLYYYFIELNYKPNQNNIDDESNSFFSTCSFANNTKKLKPSNFILKTTAQKIPENKIDNTDNSNNNNGDNNEDTNNKKKLNKKDYEEIFFGKKEVINFFIQKYQSPEFKQKLSELNAPEKLKRIYPIFLLHILISYCGFNIENKKLLEESLEIFYEEQESKATEIKLFLKANKTAKIYDENEKQINLNDIKNIDYIIEKNNHKVKINFYDYILNGHLRGLKFSDNTSFNQFFNELENWTLQKHAKENSLFFNKKISNIIEKNIYDSISNNTILKKVFKDVIPFSQFDYPFTNTKIIEQIKRGTYIFPFCNDSLGGLTLKKFGIILINNRVKKIEYKLDDKDWFFYFLLKGMIYKTVFIHEINFHYVFCLIFANKCSDSIETPIKLFKHYKTTQGDSGYKGESLIFGEKVRYMFINAALFISDDNDWKLEDDDFENIANKFLFLNRPYGEVNVIDIINNKPIAQKLLSIINEEIYLNQSTKRRKKDYNTYMFYGNSKDEDKLEIEAINYNEIYLLKGNCFPVNK